MVKILIVDDSSFMRKMVTSMVTQQGHEVVGEAANGLVAFDLYKRLKPDVVTMDITMPIVTGLESLKSIIEFDKEAKVIMCSAMGQQSLVLESVKYGAKDFIVKPFSHERLNEVIENVLQK